MTETVRLQPRGIPREKLFEQMKELKQQDADYRQGRTWSLVYYGGEELTSVLEEAYRMYFHTNALNPMAFPGLRKFENEVVAMTASMLGGGPETCGNMTSGGTESILMAVKTARDLSRARRPGVIAPEMVIPASIHPAFLKAAHYLGVKAVRTPLGDDFRADMDAVRAAVNENTILVVGSAPAYPHGVIDPIEELAALAEEKGIICHVDSSLGGFLLPFVSKLGYPVPPFDFRVPGVTSMSADVHKYGFAAKGASVILYRDREIRRHRLGDHELPGRGRLPAPGADDHGYSKSADGGHRRHSRAADHGQAGHERLRFRFRKSRYEPGGGRHGSPGLAPGPAAAAAVPAHDGYSGPRAHRGRFPERPAGVGGSG